MSELVVLGADRSARNVRATGGAGAAEPSRRVTTSPRARRRDDRRYHTQRWQRVRLRVLKRDLWVCRIVPGCQERASVADHIIPATFETPDDLFFDPGNLRAGCRIHNVARGFAEKLEAPADGQTAVVTRDYSP